MSIKLPGSGTVMAYSMSMSVVVVVMMMRRRLVERRRFQLLADDVNLSSSFWYHNQLVVVVLVTVHLVAVSVQFYWSPAGQHSGFQSRRAPWATVTQHRAQNGGRWLLLLS